MENYKIKKKLYISKNLSYTVCVSIILYDY